MDEEALIREVAENPELDAPRMVYADWLEERGDPRAEFLRLECEFNKFEFDHSAVVDLKRDLLRIWSQHDCPEWFDRVATKYNVWFLPEGIGAFGVGRISVVKALRVLTGIGLLDAIDQLAAKGPNRVCWGIDLPQAEASLKTIKKMNSVFPLSKLFAIAPAWRESPAVLDE